MKKSSLLLMLLGTAAGSAVAQTNVTIYGIADVGMVAERGGSAGSVTKLTSGVASGSRLGFRGTEDLGGGLAANFVLETGIAMDTGGFNQSSTAFGRQAFVGLSGGFGGVTFGRQYTPQYVTLVLADPFATGLAGTAANLMPNTGDAASRMNNAVKYVSPNLQGFTGELAYGFGEVAGDTSASRQYGAAIAYANGPLAVRLGYHNRNNDTATVKNTSSAKDTLLALTYDLNVAKLHLGYGINKGVNSSPLRNTTNPYGSLVAPTASTDSRDLLLGVTVPFGAHTILGSYIRKDDKNAVNQDANQWALGYRYAFSKRTDLYAAYARIKNDNGAGYTVGSAIEAGSGDKAFNLGIRHTF
ncbi:porin [Actimicrobium sp. CCC2.4]|uniref:porin n=1 Tax=Actimicrobium sp. CCC2.4 TaxID=3048606 RepID=UPI002AC9A3BD|nr:porin [Actimicrobium sp. CCC2.4]MEB0135225.1 porin [Actimicrobium sp. CCC2.4]WPX34185.1 porin [Actimicrobium sp. CCC2.4]